MAPRLQRRRFGEDPIATFAAKVHIESFDHLLSLFSRRVIVIAGKVNGLSVTAKKVRSVVRHVASSSRIKRPDQAIASAKKALVDAFCVNSEISL
jgi:hypothetical protein